AFVSLPLLVSFMPMLMDTAGNCGNQISTLMLSATFTGMVTTHYEEAFVSLPLLVSFMPMLMDTAGNCGNQISTLMLSATFTGMVTTH
ncbi:hypothetical protein P0G09_20770, partial [Faecalibacterium sp. DFI.5.82]|nr:hypothetical protein [Faecalibacterium sp. DFI.5.82]